MIVVALIGGVTTIVVASLAFAYAVVGRERRLDGVPAPLPYLYITQETPCPRCGRRYEKPDGMRGPKTCKPSDSCLVDVEHLHVSCSFCKSEWTMLPRVVG